MDHRQLATNCLRSASGTQDAELKALLLMMADFWQQLAENSFTELTAWTQDARAA
jgi:hypothetical protein